jgi:hypothetical protein
VRKLDTFDKVIVNWLLGLGVVQLSGGVIAIFTPFTGFGLAAAPTAVVWFWMARMFEATISREVVLGDDLDNDRMLHEKRTTLSQKRKGELEGLIGGNSKS